jgi:hypothetical protein
MQDRGQAYKTETPLWMEDVVGDGKVVLGYGRWRRNVADKELLNFM